MYCFVTALFMFLEPYLHIKTLMVFNPEMGGQIRTDLLFPEIALNSQLGITLQVFY